GVGLEQQRHEVVRERAVAAGLGEHERRQLVGRGALGAGEQMVVETLPHAPTIANDASRSEREERLALDPRAGRPLARGEALQLRLELLELLALLLLERLHLATPLLVEGVERCRPLLVEGFDRLADGLHHAERRHGRAEAEGTAEYDARLVVLERHGV